ncbi:PKD domain-containing protein [Chitinophaga sp. Hz27]|uniref:PKD domain-containing protein n=1 Tax=Chitinophaga sp. Hz27 TaxID=3347169 RepID=UPI0035D7A514
MKKLLFILICVMCSTLAVHAKHIIGGQVYYKFVRREANGDYTYHVTMRLYRICDHGSNIAEMPTTVYLTAYNKDDNQQYGKYTVTRSDFQEKNLGQVDPCIVNPPPVCFQVASFETDITVPINTKGYVVAFQSCCRDNFMVNIVSDPIPGQANNYGTGATYFTELPGTNNGIPGNSSPVFNKEEATLVCANKPFTYDFSASDPDGDELHYQFCDAYKGGSTTDGRTGIPDPAVAPPYDFVQYVSPYTGAAPLGPDVKIDPNTGIISGTAPNPGKYVVTVCVNEYRNGVLIGTLRKDFHVNVTTCVKQVVASMPDKYADCRSYTVTFLNSSTLGKPYTWDFGDGTPLFTTTDQSPLPHTYAAPGLYTAKLWVDKASNCGDSAIAKVYVYPRFNAAFSTDGSCIQRPVKFNDRSTLDMGTVAYYKWNFGTGVAADTANGANPTFQYKTPGNYQVILFARTSNGCEQFDTVNVSVYDKPPIFATSDTLLCAKDSLKLWATSTSQGTYSWMPSNYKILFPNTANPIVFPQKDTTYTVTFTDMQQCTNTKAVFIDRIDTLMVKTMKDSSLCTGDQITLYGTSDGPYDFTWRDLNNNTVVGKNLAITITPPPPARKYELLAELGKCYTKDTVSFKIVDPPQVSAAPDTSICSGSKVLLRASGGAYYRWSPSFYVDSPRAAITWAKPVDTTLFTVTVTDTLGCPKPVTATANVAVVPPVRAFAGNDTIIMLGHPFQLHATGGVRYTWAPPTGLNNIRISDPTTTNNKDIRYIVTAYTQEGCSGTDDILVRFIAGPDIYIPNAFSPNGDGLNDIFRPLPVGIVKMNYFRVYDRWGKLMYSSTEYMKGWDGTVNGNPAGIGTYVWIVEGVDINQNTISQKGTVTLVR